MGHELLTGLDSDGETVSTPPPKQVQLRTLVEFVLAVVDHCGQAVQIPDTGV